MDDLGLILSEITISNCLFFLPFLLECVCLKLYLYILKNQMIEIYIPMFVISLLNFIHRYKRFL